MAHITGGGLPGNIARNVPDTFDIQIKSGSWNEPAIFDLIRTKGPVNEDEMRKTFNLGIGFTVIIPASQEAQALSFLKTAAFRPGTLALFRRHRESRFPVIVS